MNELVSGDRKLTSVSLIYGAYSINEQKSETRIHDPKKTEKGSEVYEIIPHSDGRNELSFLKYYL